MDKSNKIVLTCPYCSVQCVVKPVAEVDACAHYLGTELKKEMENDKTVKVILDPQERGVFHYFII